MTALTTRDALAKALCAHYYECAETWDEPVECDHGLAFSDLDALLASGAVVDTTALADDEAAEAAFWREQEAGTTQRDRGGYFHAGFIAGFRALAAALSERAS